MTNNTAVSDSNIPGKYSTESEFILTRPIQDLAQSLKNKFQVDMVIMDFSKAFAGIDSKTQIVHESFTNSLAFLTTGF